MIPLFVERIAMDMQATTGQAPQMASAPTNLTESDNIAGVGKKEPTIVANARERAQGASQPDMA